MSSRPVPRHLHVAVIVMLLVTTVAGCVVQRNPVTGERRAYGWAWSQERQLGLQADGEIATQFGIYDDAEVQAYVEAVAERVLAESHMRRPDAEAQFRETPFTFRVLDSPVVNAFALPGGFVYVTRGLLAHMNNEAQLAVVLGHEIGHVAGRHASRRAFEQQLGQIGVIGGAILGQEVLGGQAAQMIMDLGGTAAQLLLLRYGRDDERESDRLGVEYAALNGYDVAEASEFFRSLRRISEEQQGIPTWLSSHPDPGEREQTMLRLADEWRREVNLHRTGHEELMRIVDGIVVGEDPRQGFTQDGYFYHPDLAFRFPVPSGYQVLNQPSQVLMVEPEQRAIMGLTISREASLQAAANRFTSQNGVSVVEQASTTSGGNPARYVLADVQTEQAAIRVLSFYIQHRNNIYNIIGYSQRDAFGTYQDTFLRTMTNFQTVTDSRILDAQPYRLQVITASRTAPFQSFVPSDLPPDITARDLAIINQVEIDEQIQQGRLLKIPTR